MRYAERRYDEAQENKSGQSGERRLAEVGGYERRREEQDGVHQQAYCDVKPEHGVVIARPGALHVGECLRETAALQVARDSRKDGQHAYHTHVFGRQQPSEKYPEDKVQHLCGAVVHHAPQQSFCRFFFQIVHYCAKIRIN